MGLDFGRLFREPDDLVEDCDICTILSAQMAHVNTCFNSHLHLQEKRSLEYCRFDQVVVILEASNAPAPTRSRARHGEGLRKGKQIL